MCRTGFHRAATPDRSRRTIPKGQCRAGFCCATVLVPTIAHNVEFKSQSAVAPSWLPQSILETALPALEQSMEALSERGIGAPTCAIDFSDAANDKVARQATIIDFRITISFRVTARVDDCQLDICIPPRCWIASSCPSSAMGMQSQSLIV
jgi:hypothetical protein